MKTIIDVAKLAGVSKSTVSRVISGKGSIRPETRARVEEAMAALNFVPNQMARGIRTGRTNTIALIIPESTNLYYNELLYHIEAIAREHNYMVVLCIGGSEPSRTTQYITWLQQRNVDGMIYCFYCENEVTESLYRLSATTPIVFLDNPLGTRPDTSYVGADGAADIAGVIRELHRGGAESIAFIGIKEISNNIYRFMGYRAGLSACGLPYDPALVGMIPLEEALTTVHFELGYRAAKRFMAQKRRPDAIVAATDVLAIGALRYCHEAGIAVPGEVSIAGYDNILLSTQVSPALSTVAQPVDEIAREAMDILLHKIEVDNGYNRSALMKSTFIPRGSTRLP